MGSVAGSGVWWCCRWCCRYIVMRVVGADADVLYCYLLQCW